MCAYEEKKQTPKPFVKPSTTPELVGSNKMKTLVEKSQQADKQAYIQRLVYVYIVWLSAKWNLWTENREFSMWNGCCNCYCRHLSGTRCLFSCLFVCVIHSFFIFHAVEICCCLIFFRWKLGRQQCIDEILLNWVDRKLISAYDCNEIILFSFLFFF